jgi:hypothetical protein
MTTPTMASAIRDAARDMAESLATALPGRVALWDPLTGTATIEAGLRRPVRRLNGGVSYEDLPLLPGVPLLFPGAPGQGISWLPLPGDPVLLVCCQWDPSGWSGGSPSDPQDLRTHHLGHAFAIPVALGATTTPATLTLDASATIQLGAAAVQPVALAPLVLAELAAIKTVFDIHVHTGVLTGGAISGMPVTPLPIPGSVASTKALAE